MDRKVTQIVDANSRISESAVESTGERETGILTTDYRMNADRGLEPKLIRGLVACSESSSRREEALVSLLFPRKFEPRYLGCYGKGRFSTGC